MMEKEKLLELALKLGIKKDNFEFGWLHSQASLQKQVINAALHMGLIKQEEVQ